MPDNFSCENVEEGIAVLSLNRAPVNALNPGFLKELGIIEEVVGPDNVMERAPGVARDYAAIPPKTHANVKAQLCEKELNKINPL